MTTTETMSGVEIAAELRRLAAENRETGTQMAARAAADDNPVTSWILAGAASSRKAVAGELERRADRFDPPGVTS